MKKIFLFLECLTLTSLACLQSAAVKSEPLAISTQPREIETMILQTAGSVYESPTPAQRCARVTAVALHLRTEPNPTAQVIDWLTNGEVVRVASTEIADWWLIEYGDVIGYARSVYLELLGNSEGECE